MSRRRKLSRKPKTIRNNPKRYFYDLEYVGDNWLLFDEELQMLVDYDSTTGLATTSVLCNTLKAAIHHLKKHKELQAGETFQNVCTLNGCAFPYGRDGEGGWTNG